jgi:hypothetical protein
MDMQYAHDQLYTALSALVGLEGSLPERVSQGWVCGMVQTIQGNDVPLSLQPLLHQIQNRLSSAPSPLTTAAAAGIALDILHVYGDLLYLWGRASVLQPTDTPAFPRMDDADDRSEPTAPSVSGGRPD